MDKKLAAYVKYIEKEAEKPSPELIEYHKIMLEQFQHERFIHLIVTMFFALFLMLFFGLFVGLSLYLPGGAASNLLIGGTGLIALILLVTTIFYVRHYYLLENGVEKLEDITRKLYKRDFYKNK